MVWGVAAFILLQRYYPLYSGEATFIVQPGVRSASDVGVTNDLNDEEVYRIAKTELHLMAQRDVLEAAINSPDVRDNCSWFRDNYISPSGTPLINEAVDQLEKELSMTPIRGTSLFAVRWSSHNPNDVPIVLNAVADAYINRRRELDEGVYNSTLDLFNRQLDKTMLQIQDLEAETQAFIRSTGITSLDDPRYGEQTMTMDRIVRQLAESKANLSVQLTLLRQAQAKLQGTMEYSPDDRLAAEQLREVATLTQRVDDLRVEIAVAYDRYGSDHQIIRQIESRLRSLETERDAKVEEAIKKSLNARLESLTAAIEQSQELIEDLESRQEEKDTELRSLASSHSAYDALETRRSYLEQAREADQLLIKEINLMKVRQDAARVRPASRAVRPREMSFPKPLMVAPIGVLVVTGFTLGIIFLRELTDQRVKTASDLSVIPGSRILGIVPETDEDPTKCKVAELAVTESPNSVVAESFRQICTPFVKSMAQSDHQTAVFLAGLPGAGTSTVMTNIAAGCAETGRRVLVVDANFRRPRLADIAGVDRDRAGLGDILAGDATISETVSEMLPGVDLITAGTPSTRIVGRLNAEQFDSVVADLRSQYDFILFDTAPAIVAGDAMVLANRLDAAVLVVRALQEQRGLIARLMNQLIDTHCDLLGLVLNRARNTTGGYHKKNFATMAAYARSKS